MCLTDEELKASMMAEAEGAIEKLLRQKQPVEQMTLTEIEGLVLKAREEVGAGLTRILVEESATVRQVPGPACPECGREMHYKGLKVLLTTHLAASGIPPREKQASGSTVLE